MAFKLPYLLILLIVILAFVSSIEGAGKVKPKAKVKPKPKPKPKSQEENDEESGAGDNEEAEVQVLNTMPMKRNNSMQNDFTNVFLGPELKTKSALPKNIVDEIDAIAEIVNKKSLFLDLDQKHMQALSKLLVLFRAKKKTEEFLDLAKNLRDHPNLNYKIWLKAFVAVTFERPEFQGMQIPSLFQLLPQSYLSLDSVKRDKKGRGFTGCLKLDETTTAVGNDANEQKLWYFREDLLSNYRHWIWHIIFERDSPYTVDRRGEIFGYHHYNIMARYHAERISNGLQPIEPIVFEKNWVLKEGYDAHLGGTLNDVLAKKNGSFGLRAPNKKFPNVLPFKNYVTVLKKDIEGGNLIRANGSKVSLSDPKNTEIFGMIFEATRHQTINQKRYHGFGIHNTGHQIIAEMSIGQFGVMASSENSMRDPAFYRWHSYVDLFFDEARKYLVPYQPKEGKLQLSWIVARPTAFSVKVNEDTPLADNKLVTFFQTKKLTVNFTAAIVHLDHTIDLCIKSLNHKPFAYHIKILSSAPKNATVRIFMAPRYNLQKKRFSMEEQRKLFFPMDQFVVNLKKGNNLLSRESIHSSLTIPSELDLTNSPNHCPCGWSQHLLLPKGIVEGAKYDLVIMLTDREEDTPKGYKSKPEPCMLSHIVCGRSGVQYPDARPIGYPFDRKLDPKIKNLEDFIRPNINMKSIQVTIIHSPELVEYK